MKYATVFVLLLGLLSGPSPVLAQDELENYSVGGGISHNSVSGGGSAFGWQIQGGYDFGPVLGDARVLAEVGFMNTGSFGSGPGGGSASGLWASGLAALPLVDYWSLLGRVGMDFGDDDGLLVGVGAEYRAMPDLDLRGEFVTRNNIDSLQFNVIYNF